MWENLFHKVNSRNQIYYRFCSRKTHYGKTLLNILLYSVIHTVESQFRTEYLGEIETEFENILVCFSGTHRWVQIMKKWQSKISWHSPFMRPFLFNKDRFTLLTWCNGIRRVARRLTSCCLWHYLLFRPDIGLLDNEIIRIT